MKDYIGFAEESAIEPKRYIAITTGGNLSEDQINALVKLRVAAAISDIPVAAPMVQTGLTQAQINTLVVQRVTTAIAAIPAPAPTLSQAQIDELVTEKVTTAIGAKVPNIFPLPVPELQIRNRWSTSDLQIAKETGIPKVPDTVRIHFAHPLSPEVMVLNPEIWLFRYAKRRRPIPNVKITLHNLVQALNDITIQVRNNPFDAEAAQGYMTIRTKLARQLPDHFFPILPSQGHFEAWSEIVFSSAEEALHLIQNLPDNARWYIVKHGWGHPPDLATRTRPITNFWFGDAQGETEFYGETLKATLASDGYADISLTPSQWRPSKRRPVAFRFALVVDAQSGGRGGKHFSELSNTLRITKEGFTYKFDVNSMFMSHRLRGGTI